MELGRALEAAGDPTNGEKALRRAVELAPSYSHPRWQYGNLLLRQGRVDEAFAELVHAADADEAMRSPVFGLASQVFSDDPERIAKVLSSPSLRLQFALSLVNSGKPDEAMNVIHTMSAADRKSESAIIDEIVKAFIARHYYHAAVSLMRDSQADPTGFPAPEQISNGSFEASPVQPEERPFHWSSILMRRCKSLSTTRARIVAREVCTCFSSPPGIWRAFPCPKQSLSNPTHNTNCSFMYGLKA